MDPKIKLIVKLDIHQSKKMVSFLEFSWGWVLLLPLLYELGVVYWKTVHYVIVMLLCDRSDTEKLNLRVRERDKQMESFNRIKVEFEAATR